jgi:hypothetical protein
MKRRLWFLNVILIALLGVIGLRFEQIQQDFRSRAARNLNQAVKPDKMPQLPPVAAPGPAVAANYADVAIKMLFSRDRNPTVILDPVAPPPEKPMPPLPIAYGAMFFGEPSIILGLPNVKGVQRTYRKGEVVGDFKLVAFDNQNIVFEWDGKTVERRLDQIMVRPSDVPQEAAPAAASSAPKATASTTPVTGPGQQNNDGNRSCVPGDKTPAGTVVDGFRKFELQGPFGKACRWEPVK